MINGQSFLIIPDHTLIFGCGLAIQKEYAWTVRSARSEESPYPGLVDDFLKRSISTPVLETISGPPVPDDHYRFPIVLLQGIVQEKAPHALRPSERSLHEGKDPRGCSEGILPLFEQLERASGQQVSAGIILSQISGVLLQD